MRLNHIKFKNLTNQKHADQPAIEKLENVDSMLPSLRALLS